MTSIRTKLLIGLLVPLSLVAALVSFETFFTAQKISKDLNDRTLLAASLTILEQVIASDGTLLAEDTLETLTENLGDRYFYHVSGPNGAFVTGYSGYPRLPQEFDASTEYPFFFDAIHLGEVVRVVRIQRDFSDRELSGVTTITTWQRTEQRSALTFELFNRSLARLALLVLAAGSIVWFAVRWGLGPLISLQAAIDRRTPEELTPIRRAMPPELSGIVGSMNSLLKRVARSKKNRERFIGDAAHQLKNPIAAIKVQAETALSNGKKEQLEDSMNEIVAVTNQSTEMINKMLSGASAYAVDKTTFERVSLLKLVDKVVSNNAKKAFDRGHELSVTGNTQGLEILGDETLLREALSNLLDNSIRYAPVQSQIGVAIEQDENVKISVIDEGEPFQDEDFLLLKQPFISGDQQDVGSGLGLSIAKDIAKAHGGYLATSATANGKQVSLILPKISA